MWKKPLTFNFMRNPFSLISIVFLFSVACVQACYPGGFYYLTSAYEALIKNLKAMHLPFHVENPKDHHPRGFPPLVWLWGGLQLRQPFHLQQTKQTFI